MSDNPKWTFSHIDPETGKAVFRLGTKPAAIIKLSKDDLFIPDNPAYLEYSNTEHGQQLFAAADKAHEEQKQKQEQAQNLTKFKPQLS
jgi:PhoPQ-activated pathogenicity-related protein